MRREGLENKSLNEAILEIINVHSCCKDIKKSCKDSLWKNIAVILKNEHLLLIKNEKILNVSFQNGLLFPHIITHSKQTLQFAQVLLT